MGAAGRDFHDFNVAFRDNPDITVVAFTASQIPGIDHRIYPASLAGSRYPQGIQIYPEAELPEIIRRDEVDQVILAYSDLSYEDVMHKASVVVSAGADFQLLNPSRTALRADVPVIAVCAVRTGSGKSQTSRYVSSLFREAGFTVALVRHPMPYGDLEKMRCQRFATLSDIDRAEPTIEEREEYEEPVRRGLLVYSGVDYREILEHAEAESDVIVWDGGNNDTPFFVPNVHITVADALRPGHEVAYYPAEVNVRLADIIVINKVDSADHHDVLTIEENIRKINQTAVVVHAASPVVLDPGPSLEGARVLVVEDGPSLTHGGAAFGAGTVAARAQRADIVDPRPFAVGSLVDVFESFPRIGRVVPAMGYSAQQIRDLEATIQNVDCDVVVCGTPFDLGRLIRLRQPLRRARYELNDLGEPTLAQALEPHVISLKEGPTLHRQSRPWDR
ncbi:MAG TPA: GTP-binding protein [Acidimicrobiales bacterium]|nr:GTP-binding protein [Acidimicrobiales bacterium]